jgi:hypothetical protein
MRRHGPRRFGRREERREALGVDHKRLLYCVNVNCTSLDHLLLGESADIDQMSNETSITPEESGCRTNFPSQDLGARLLFGARRVRFRRQRLWMVGY